MTHELRDRNGKLLGTCELAQGVGAVDVNRAVSRGELSCTPREQLEPEPAADPKPEGKGDGDPGKGGKSK